MNITNLKELKEKFPKGSLVKFCSCSCEKIEAKYLGSTATVVGYAQTYPQIDNETTLHLVVEWDKGLISKPIYYWHFELINSPEINSNICPKCGKEMIKKQSESYGLIDKCPNCGYC